MAPAFKVKKQERDDPEYEDRLSPSEPNEPGVEYEHKNGFHDPSGRLDYRDLPPSYVVANYPMELVPNSPVGGSALNGATRQIPGTQNSHALGHTSPQPHHALPCTLHAHQGEWQ